MFSADRNINAFVLFRTAFNTRFYYPVLAVMFVDYGLTMEQYTLLNVAWAAAIVGFEVPSGALADTWGRKQLVTLSASLMVVEMLLLAGAPLHSTWLFPLMLFNRLLSGLAEAAASGADEALAFDSLKQEGREGEWSNVLERIGKWQAAAFFVAMLFGSLLYDPRVWAFLGLDGVLPRDLTIRFPAMATAVMSLLALAAALRMREPAVQTTAIESCGSWRQVLDTGRWILHTPRVLALISVGFCLDSIMRLFMTFQSTYLRWIDLPDFSFGPVGCAFAVVSFLLQPVARRLADKHTVTANIGLTVGLSLLGLVGCAFGWKYGGVLFALVLGGGMTFTGFFLSYYLNHWTESHRRATALSFKGLAFNLAYGTVGAGFALLLHAIHQGNPSLSEVEQFGASLRWLPLVFILLLAITLLLTGPRAWQAAKTIVSE